MGWECSPIGKRTPQRGNGTWENEECTLTSFCNVPGTRCVRKDRFASFCKRDHEVPDDWDGTVIGGGREPYEVSPAPRNERQFGRSLYCFTAVRSHTFEVQLAAVAEASRAGIFSCNDAQVFVIPSVPGTLPSAPATSAAFVEAWKQVRAASRWRSHDYTVKADADCVFTAYRLQYRLAQLRVPESKPVYVLTSDDGSGFFSPLEIMNKLAVQDLFENLQDCGKGLAQSVPQEDQFLKACLDASGAGYMRDSFILGSTTDGGLCVDATTRVAFQPHKAVQQWLDCYNKINVA